MTREVALGRVAPGDQRIQDRLSRSPFDLCRQRLQRPAWSASSLPNHDELCSSDEWRSFHDLDSFRSWRAFMGPSALTKAKYRVRLQSLYIV